MEDNGNSILLESESKILTEKDYRELLLLESAPSPISINNYEFVRAGDGISVSEKIR